jgi:hypothetical protein
VQAVSAADAASRGHRDEAMNTIKKTALLAASVLLLGVSAAYAEDPAIKDLGDGRYQIGEILLDKSARRFTVPGRVIHLTGPIEYIAVAKGGMKEYESVFELNTSATEFQLACILIGFDDSKSEKPRYQFDERPAKGQAVDIEVSWEVDGKSVRVPAANTLLEGDEPFDDHRWVYIGSNTQNGGELTAEMIGSLIGIVHDPDAIIDHVRGAGIGAYGLVTANKGLLPPEVAPVTFSIALVATEGGEEEAENSEGN